MARLRTFLAVEIGAAIRDRCVSLQETLARTGARVKWVEPDNLHVTLLFLGEVDAREVPPLSAAVKAVCERHAPFTLRVEGVGGFPNALEPRVVWAGLSAGAAEVIALHDDLEPPLLELGCYRREDRQYAPHLTLGRCQGQEDGTLLATGLDRQTKWRGGETLVAQVLVLSSELSSRGPVYTVLDRAPLRGEVARET